VEDVTREKYYWKYILEGVEMGKKMKQLLQDQEKEV
jgi:hypothetical protein